MKTLLCLIAALAATASIANPAFAQPFPESDHYLSYRVEPQTLGAQVMVEDQFVQQPAQVVVLERLLNPVRQNNEAYFDSTAHLNWWRIQPNTPVNLQVIVTNKFGSGVWNISELQFLLAPARKNQPPPFPENINHFLCYRAQGPAPNVVVTLEDQFRRFTAPVGPPQFFCNPCRKVHAGGDFPIVDPEVHFAVYLIDSPPFSIQGFTFDQFGQHPMLVTSMPPEYLFVPSRKDRVVPTESGTWGRLKAIYRGRG